MTAKLRKNIREKIRDLEDQRAILVAIVDEYIGESKNNAESLLASSDSSSFLQKYMEVMRNLDRCYNTCVLLTAEAEETLENGKEKSIPEQTTNIKTVFSEQGNKSITQEQAQGIQSTEIAPREKHCGNQSNKQAGQPDQFYHAVSPGIRQENCNICDTDKHLSEADSHSSTSVGACNYNIPTGAIDCGQSLMSNISHNLGVVQDNTSTETDVHKKSVPKSEKSQYPRKSHLDKSIDALGNDVNLNEDCGKPYSSKQFMNIVKVEKVSAEEEVTTTRVGKASQDNTRAADGSTGEYATDGVTRGDDTTNWCKTDQAREIPEKEFFSPELDQFRPRLDMNATKRFLQGIVNQANKDKEAQSQLQSKVSVQHSQSHDITTAIASIAVGSIDPSKSAERLEVQISTRAHKEDAQGLSCDDVRRGVDKQTIDKQTIGKQLNQPSGQGGVNESCGIHSVSPPERSDPGKSKVQTNSVSCKTNRDVVAPEDTNKCEASVKDVKNASYYQTSKEINEESPVATETKKNEPNPGADNDLSSDPFFAHLSTCTTSTASTNSQTSPYSDDELKMESDTGVVQHKITALSTKIDSHYITENKASRKGHEERGFPDKENVKEREKETESHKYSNLETGTVQKHKASEKQRHRSAEASSVIREKERDMGYALGPILTTECIELNKIVSVVISEPCSPWFFYVQKWSPDLMKLSEQMSIYLASERADTQQVQTPVVGMICLAKFSKDKVFYRARITHVQEKADKEKQVDVIFVDFGNTERRKPEHLRELPQIFAQLPGQAIPCALAKVAPSNKYNVWTESDILKFAKFASGQRYNCIPIHASTEPDQPSLVELFYNMPRPVMQGNQLVLVPGPQQISIHEYLIKEGCAKRITVEEQLSLLSVTVSNDTNTVSPSLKCSEASEVKVKEGKGQKSSTEGQGQGRDITQEGVQGKDSNSKSVSQSATEALPRIPRPTTKSRSEAPENDTKENKGDRENEKKHSPTAKEENQSMKENKSAHAKAQNYKETQQRADSKSKLSPLTLRSNDTDSASKSKNSSNSRHGMVNKNQATKAEEGVQQAATAEGGGNQATGTKDVDIEQATSTNRDVAIQQGKAVKRDVDYKDVSNKNNVTHSSDSVYTQSNKTEKRESTATGRKNEVERNNQREARDKTRSDQLSKSVKCGSVESLESGSIHYPADDEIDLPSSFDVHTDGLNVMLSHINSPSDFYVHLVSKNCGKTLDDIMKSLNKRLEQFSRKKLQKLSKSFNVCVGDLCAARYTQDNQFYRALVTSIQLSSPVKRSSDSSETEESCGSIHVFYLDFGDREVLPRRRVFPLPSELMEIPGLSLHCKLAYVRPSCEGKKGVSDNVTWSDVAKETFVSFTGFEKTLQMLVIQGNVMDTLESHPSVAEKASALKVLLVDSQSVEQDVCINMELIRLGHATIDPNSGEQQQVSTPEKLSTWDPMMDDYLSVRNSYNIDVNDAGVATTGYKAQDEYHVCKYFKLNDCWRGDNCPYRHVLEPPGALTVDLESVYANWDEVHQDEVLPEPGTWIACEVSTIITPAHFYIILPWGKKPLEVVEKEDKEDERGGVEDTLERLMADMQEHYNSKSFQSNYVHYAPGEIIVAKFTGDSQWYRARVVCVDENELQVFYLDFGNKEWIKESNTQRMDPCFLHLPFQAIECFLMGIEPYDGNEPSYKDAKQAMRKMVDGKTLVGYIKSRSWGGCVWLELFDTTGEDDISIARTLIDSGLAQESSRNRTSSSTSGVISNTSSRIPSQESLILIPG